MSPAGGGGGGGGGGGDVGGGGAYYPSPPPFPFSFHLVEVTVISAQELFPASRAMETYAVAWVEAGQKVRTRLDRAGHTDPAWNDKFVFRVPDASLRSATSAVTVELYARSRLRGALLLGTARALLSTLRPSPAPRFAAVQVRRPVTLRPQGILNLSVALLDAYARSLPLYADLSPSPSPNHPHRSARPPPPAASAASAAAAVDREREEMEAKLEKWRAELPPMKGATREAKGKEKGGEGKGSDGGGEGKGGAWWRGGSSSSSSRRRRNSFGRFSCFSPATESGEVAVVRFAREREFER